MTPLAFLAQGAGLGLTAAGTPGPLLALLVAQSLDGGWRRGLPLILAPLIADAPIILLIVVILGQLPLWALRALGGLGGLFVLYLAWRLWRRWRAGTAAAIDAPAAVSLRQAVAANFLNPNPYLFWALVGGPILLEALARSPGHAALFLLGFYGLFLGGMALIVFVFDRARRFGPRLVRGLMLASVIVLVIFGLLLLGRALFS